MKNKKYLSKCFPSLFSLIFLFCLSIIDLFAQAPEIEWQNTIGGNSYEEIRSIVQNPDGSYVCAGFSSSGISGDKSEATMGALDYWVLKLNGDGEIEWQKTIGGNDEDELHCIRATADGGYILGGYSLSGISGNKTVADYGLRDIWLVKLSSTGDIEWQKSIGGDKADKLRDLQPTADGGFICGGYSKSGISIDKTEVNQGNFDYWVFKLNSNLEIEWQNTIGGNDEDVLRAVLPTPDGGYICGGYSNSDLSGKKTEAAQGDSDYWVIKLSNAGIIEWQNAFGGEGTDKLRSLQLSFDGGYICGGSSDSDISIDKTENSNGSHDCWVVKLNPAGNIEWQNTIGGSGNDILYYMQQTSDSGFVFGGYSTSDISGDKTEPNKGECIDLEKFCDDFWIVKLTSTGNIVWQKTIGGSEDDGLQNIQLTSDGGYICGGYSSSGISGNKTEISNGDYDYWVVKLGCTPKLWFADTDSDGYGNVSLSSFSCFQPVGFKSDNTDCNDSNSSVHPTALEICNTIDDNCNTLIDENSLSATINFSGTISTCSGIAITLIANSGSEITYQWQRNSTNVSGATNSTYETSKAGKYQVKEFNNLGCSSTSEAVNLKIINNPIANITPLGNLDICLTGSVLLQANEETGFTYQWNNGGNNISGATNQTYTATKTKKYTVTVTNSDGCNKTSQKVIVTNSCKESSGRVVLSSPELELYPNPTDDKFIINLHLNNKEDTEATLQLINALGQNVYDQRIWVINGELIKEIEFHAPSAGIYIVRVIVNDLVITKQLVISR